jgi:hypothetical protein
MNEFQEQMCFVFSVYGTALERADIVPLLGEADELLAAAGQPTTHLQVRARGFGKPPLRFRNAWKRLQKTAPDDLTSVHLYSFVEDWQTTSDWTAICYVLPERSYFDLGAGLATMPDAEQRILGFIRRWLDRMRPAYGIGFFRKRGRGADCYGLGIPCEYGVSDVYDGPEYEKKLQEMRVIRRWRDGMRNAVYNDGTQRDVFPYNLLTAVHLERDIDGQSLRDWIHAEPARGQLTECPGAGYALWTVAPEHIPDVRRQLAPSGVLFVLRPENRH